jgi:hypothetical protein
LGVRAADGPDVGLGVEATAGGDAVALTVEGDIPASLGSRAASCDDSVRGGLPLAPGPADRANAPNATAAMTRTATREPIAATRWRQPIVLFERAWVRRRRSATGVALATISRFRRREAT